MCRGTPWTWLEILPSTWGLQKGKYGQVPPFVHSSPPSPPTPPGLEEGQDLLLSPCALGKACLQGPEQSADPQVWVFLLLALSPRGMTVWDRRLSLCLWGIGASTQHLSQTLGAHANRNIHGLMVSSWSRLQLGKQAPRATNLNAHGRSGDPFFLLPIIYYMSNPESS